MRSEWQNVECREAGSRGCLRSPLTQIILWFCEYLQVLKSGILGNVTWLPSTHQTLSTFKFNIKQVCKQPIWCLQQFCHALKVQFQMLIQNMLFKWETKQLWFITVWTLALLSSCSIKFTQFYMLLLKQHKLNSRVAFMWEPMGLHKSCVNDFTLQCYCLANSRTAA